MATHRVTAKGGPLHGKSYDVPHNMTEFPAPTGTQPGRYKVTEKQATWEPASKPAPEPTTVKAAPEPTAKPKRPAKVAAKAAASAAPEAD